MFIKKIIYFHVCLICIKITKVFAMKDCLEDTKYEKKKCNANIAIQVDSNNNNNNNKKTENVRRNMCLRLRI